MPPANSPVNDPSHLAIPSFQPSQSNRRTPSPSTFVPALRNFGSSVPDLASTLTLQAENDVDAANVDFLRSPEPSNDLPDQSSDQAMEWRSTSTTNVETNEGTRQQQSMLLRTHLQRQEEEQQQREQRRLRDLHLRQRYTTHESWAESMRQTATRTPYGNRAPNQQSLYDWAPASEEGDPEELEDILADLRQQQPNTHNDILRVLARAQLDAQNEYRRLALSRTQANDQPHPSQHEQSLRSAAILRSVRANRQLSARSRDLMQRYVIDRDRASNAQDAAGGDQGSGSSSRWFRSSTPGAHRQESAEAASPTPYESTTQPDRAQREREREERRSAHRIAQQRLDREREAVSTPSSRPSVVISPSNTRRSGETMDSLRRRYLEDPSGTPYKFENSIKLLDWLRNPDFDVDDLLRILDKEVANAGATIDVPDLAKLTKGLPPSQTDWLRPGMIFSGFQHAAALIASASSSGNTTYYRLANNQTISSTVINPPSDNATNSVPPGVSGSTAPLPPPNSLQRDRWAVRVSIHDVDYANMTLQGTMEAFDVPSSAPSSTAVPFPYRASTSALRTTLDSTTSQQPAPPQQQQQQQPSCYQNKFSTYLEGELLDLSKHTLATHSFAATTAADAQYWRRLAPFARAPDLAMAKNALDPAWLAAELQHKYVLMRWKEKCFVKECLVARPDGTPREPRDASDANANNGAFGLLSISGFYYVSLRRADGHVEALYYDPQSTPYQHLEMTPEDSARTHITWEFA